MCPKTLSQTSEQRFKELDTQLKGANEKAQLFEMIVAVIRDDFGIVISKKFSGKSLKKRKYPQ